LQSIVNHGPGEESLAREVEAASEGTARLFQCSISELIALTRQAKLFIGGDTGPLHLASALKIPVVAVFGPTDPARNGPYGTRSIVLRNSGSSTSHARIAQPDQAMLEITVDAVVDAARTLLSNNNAHQSPAEAAHG
jgi:heptosyltransferase-1